MLAVQQTFFAVLRLINVQALVNCEKFLERERERELSRI